MKKSNFNFYYLLSLVGQIGWTVSLPLVILIILGFFLDQKFATKPLFTLIGLGGGILLSLGFLYQLIKKLIQNK
jgi:ATP synthase protein I